MARSGENIYKRKDGRWEGRYIIKSAKGSKYGYIYAKEYSEVKAQLKTLRIQSGIQAENIIPQKEDIFKNIAERWFAGKKLQIKESTAVKYRNILDSYLYPFIGDFTFPQLNHGSVEELSKALLLHGSKTGEKLSPKTVSDEIHKDILSIYADSSNKVVSHSESSKGEMIVFTSPAGGTGCSTIAAACSIHCAKAGKKTLYLNLNPFDNPEIWFSGNGKTGMSDLVYAVKSRNSNFSVKVESCLRKSEEGVFFFGECEQSLDIIELDNADKEFMISGLRESGLFDVIVLDIPFDLEMDTMKLIEPSMTILWINDGRRSSASKIQNAYAAFKVIDNDTLCSNKIRVLNNKYRQKEYRSAAGVPKVGEIEFITADGIKVEELAQNTFFDKLV